MPIGTLLALRREQTMNKEESTEEFEALSTFCYKYEPAKKELATEHFSSKEIQKIVLEHTGKKIELIELNKLLTQMNYDYELLDDQFRWMMKVSL